MSQSTQSPDSIEFHCTGCGRALKVPVSAAGKRASCPQCNAIVQVPAISPSQPPVDGDGRRGEPEIKNQSSANPVSDAHSRTSDLRPLASGPVAWALPPQ